MTSWHLADLESSTNMYTEQRVLAPTGASATPSAHTRALLSLLSLCREQECFQARALLIPAAMDAPLAQHTLALFAPHVHRLR